MDIEVTPVGIQPAPANEHGWHELVQVPGAPRGSVRVGEAPRSGSSPLAAFVHFSDLHLCDAESPARLTMLEQYGAFGSPYRERLNFPMGYRAQEILTVQVGVASVTAANRIDTGPVSGRPIDAVIATGDVVDNSQRNELGWYTTLMAGGDIEPWSGDRTISSWVGATPTTPEAWSPVFWHPDGSPDGVPPDLATGFFGYPTMPGLVAAARATVTSPGVGVPWLTVHGNHDRLLQGVTNATDTERALALGDRRWTGVAPDRSPMSLLETDQRRGPSRYPAPGGPSAPVVPDAARALIEDPDFVAAHDGGHGFEGLTDADVAAGRRYWTATVGDVRLVALDTVNPHGGWEGSLDWAQVEWLRETLAAHAGEYTVVLSHHPSWTLYNPYSPDGTQRAVADEVLTILLANPQVVAWVAGHVHANTSLWHPAVDGRDGGLWEITTASFIDWPQQFRVLEVLREPGGTVAIASTIVDHDGGVGAVKDADLGTVAGLAGVARTLASNDYRHRDNLWRRLAMQGLDKDLDAVWRLPDPFA